MWGPVVSCPFMFCSNLFGESWNIIDFINLAVTTKCKDRVIKRAFNMFCLSHLLSVNSCVLGKVCIPAYFCPSFFHLAPPLSLLQQGTDERSKVSPVEEAAFCRSHASASLHTHTHTHSSPYPRVGGLSWEPLQVLSKHTQISIHEHSRSPVADGSLPEWHSATSDPFCVLPNHHQHTLNYIHNHHQCPQTDTSLYFAYYAHTSSSPQTLVVQKTAAPVIQQLSVISAKS